MIVGGHFMKKLLSVFSLLLVVFALTACGNKNDANNNSGTNAEGGSASSSTYELALITDVGTIDDKSFNQGAWEGLKQYAEEKKVSYKYYQPAEKSTEAYIKTMKLAVEAGAKVIVCPGYLFEKAVFQEQTEYPDVKFILLDGQPHNADSSDMTITDNTYAVFYAEQEAGFLAGYAAVKEGYTKLGFMGGIAVPAVIRYGYGFVEGAEYAAKELGIDGVEIKYHYTGGFTATPEAQATAASWYNAGTEIIFACGGGVGNSVMAAAETAGAKVIGVDVDQSPESDTVITSAMKQLSVSVYDGIAAYYEGNFPGGKVVTLDATSNAVGLPLETSKFTKFTQADYDAIFKKLVDKEIVPSTQEAGDDVTKLPVEKVKVESVN